MDAVLDVVHRVGHVVGPVHHLGLQAATRSAGRAARAARRRPAASSAYTPNLRWPGRRGHGYLQDGVERGPGQVEPGGRRRPAPSTLASSRVSTRSVCALPSKPPQACGDLVERVLAVVPERRVAEVVRQAGGVHHVGVAAEPRAHLPADLGDLQRVGQPGAQEVVGCRRVCTWVLAASRRNAAECSTRARSRWNGCARRRPAGSGVLRRLVDEALPSEAQQRLDVPSVGRVIRPGASASSVVTVDPSSRASSIGVASTLIAAATGIAISAPIDAQHAAADEGGEQHRDRGMSTVLRSTRGAIR